jgi:hypothetical protein
MKKIKFTIRGNHEDPTGNPLPKIKKTRNSYWTKEAQRYAKWKAYVQMRLLDALFKKMPAVEFDEIKRRIASGEKPIALPRGARSHMDIRISWKNGAHADPENVFGSIADALFENDKNLAGSFDFELADDGIGRVAVDIAFSLFQKHIKNDMITSLRINNVRARMPLFRSSRPAACPERDSGGGRQPRAEVLRQ